MFLRKVFYFGLGLVGYVYDTVKELASRGEARISHDVAQATEGIELVIGNGQTAVAETVVVAPAAKPAPKAKAVPKTAVKDDLTQIKGIGPTYARRLEKAGITSFATLSRTSPDRLREVAGLKEWQADPAEWVTQAKAMA